MDCYYIDILKKDNSYMERYMLTKEQLHHVVIPQSQEQNLVNHSTVIRVVLL